MNREAIFLFLLGRPPFPVLNNITSVAFSSSVAADVYNTRVRHYGHPLPSPRQSCNAESLAIANTPCAAPATTLHFRRSEQVHARHEFLAFTHLSR